MSASERDPKVEGKGNGGGDGGAVQTEGAARASAALSTVEGVVDRQSGADGQEMVLLRRGEAFEIQLEGQCAMASDARRSERSLVELALAPLSLRDDITVLVAGLGMGHLLRAVLDQPKVVRVDVVEMSSAVIEWNRRHFGPLNGDALLDGRVHLHHADLLGFLKQTRYSPIPEVEEGWLAVILDVDNGPDWLTRSANAAIYTDDGLARLETSLRHGGVLALWSAERALEFYRRMHARLANVAELAVPVEIGGRSSLDYVYRGRRRPEPRSGTGGKMAQA